MELTPLSDLNLSFLVELVGNLAFATASIGCAYLLIASVLVRRYIRTKRAPVEAPASISLLKPLCGDEPELLRRLESFSAQNFDGSMQIVLGCQDPLDPAIAKVRMLKRMAPEQDIELVVDPRLHGMNRKVSNLINMMTRVKHSIVVASDSDIEVAPDYLSQIVGALAQPGVGAVTCLYHGAPGRQLAGELSALAINAHFLPNVVMAVSCGLACPCLGATIAMRRDTLSKIGGFHAFVDRLADDYSIGQAVRAAGLSIALPNFTVSHACNETRLRDFLKRQLRSARTIKSLDPFGYAGAIIVNPFPLALLATLSGFESGLILAVVAYACRAILYEAVVRSFHAPRQRYALLAVVDLALFGVFAASFFGSSVTWRGRRYRLVPDGTLSHDSR